MKLYTQLQDNKIYPDSCSLIDIDEKHNDDIDITHLEELPPKLARLMVFGEWILYQLHISDIERENVRNILHVYDEPDAQYEFYNIFTTSEKQITKNMKKHISQQKKLPKPIAIHGIIKTDIPKTRNQILKEEYINKLIDMFAPIV